jgi:hypothetical protein
MADSNVVLRKWLLSEATVISLLGTNKNGSVYAPNLIEGFDPKLGPAIQVSVVGGNSHPEIVTVDDDLMQVRIWADVEAYQQARQLYIAVKRVLHGASGIEVPGAGAFIMRCQETLSGQDITDPETGWATVLARFQLMFRDM